MVERNLTQAVFCPLCKEGRPRVKDTRYLDEFRVIKRVRLCSNCGAVFITTEKLTVRDSTESDKGN